MTHLLRALFLICLIGFAAGTTVGTATAVNMTIAMATATPLDMSGFDMPDCAGGKSAAQGMMACDRLCATMVAGVLPQQDVIAALQPIASLERFPLILLAESRNPGLDLPPPRSVA